MSNEKSKAIKNYVHQVKDVEVARLTLKKANEKIAAHGAQFAEAHKNNLLKIENELNTTKSTMGRDQAYYAYLQTSKPKGFWGNLFSFDHFAALFICLFWCALGGVLGGIIIGVGIACILDSLFGLPWAPTNAIIVIGALIGACFGWRFGLVRVDDHLLCFNFSTKKQEIELRKKSFYRLSAKLNENSQRIQQLEQDKMQAEEMYASEVAALRRQIALNNQNLVRFENILSRYYDLDIIPIDYRSADCMITLDHIFQNDLADTVREAILLYQNWLHQEWIIQGLERIYSMLGNLSVQMQYMQHTLDSIEANTTAMCSEIANLVEVSKKQNRTQEELLSETRCARYAAESIQKSSEKYEWYMEQHRQGLL